MRRKDDEKERNIKEAVIKLILKEGFQGTSISKIAKEAGVSPATVYIYYENKEAMLHDIYTEYSEEIFEHLLDKVNNVLEGRQLIEILAREYYTYIKHNNEIFHFVEQFSNCPALACGCTERKGIYNLHTLLEEMKNRKIFKDFQNDNMIAMLFSPIKYIAVNHCIEEQRQDELLKEMIGIIQDILIEK